MPIQPKEKLLLNILRPNSLHFNIQEKNCQCQSIILLLPSTDDEMHAIFMSLKKMSGYCLEQRINSKYCVK